jgi:poly(A) polymerase
MNEIDSSRYSSISRSMDRKQFQEIILSSDVDVRLERLQVDGVLSQLFPEVQAMVGFGGGDTGHKDLWGHTKQVVAQCVKQPVEVRWAALFHDVGKVKCFKVINGEVTFRHHEAASAQLFEAASMRTGFFDAQETHDIKSIIANLGYVEGYIREWTDSAVRRVHRETGIYFLACIDLSRADITTKYAAKRLAHHERIKELHDRAMELARLDARLPALPKGLGRVLGERFNLNPVVDLGPLMTKLKAAVEDGLLERSSSVETILEFIQKERLL